MIQKNKLIEKALKEYPAARNSDRKLMLAVWHLQNPNYMSDFKYFFQNVAITPETIRRRRQKLQQDGKYKADEVVDDFRYEKFKQARADQNVLWEHEV